MTGSELPTVLARLSEPAFIADPYPYYRELLKTGPFEVPGVGMLVGRYDHAVTALRDPAFSADPESAGRPPARALLARSFIRMDPPAHTRLRLCTARALADLIADHGPDLIDRAVETAVRRLAGRRECDLVADYARPIASGVMRGLLGVPESD